MFVSHLAFISDIRHNIGDAAVFTSIGVDSVPFIHVGLLGSSFICVRLLWSAAEGNRG
jgi:hypothetical protein